MLRHVRMLFTTSAKYRIAQKPVHKIFGKYLFATNTVSSGVLLGLGDLIQQEIEYQQKILSKRYDFARAGRMFLVGLSQGPLHHYFYKYLDIFLPQQTLKSVTLKIFLDQVIASPVCIVTFFYGMDLLEGKSLNECYSELKDKFLTVYITDWCVWPPTQFINFYFLAPHYRVLYINFVTMVYDIFLSYIKHKKIDTLTS